MSIKINTTMQYNGEENSSGRKSDSSTISQILRLVSNRLKKIRFLTLCSSDAMFCTCLYRELSPESDISWLTQARASLKWTM